MYINADTKEYPLTRLDIAARHPNTSFPAAMSETAMNSLGYYTVQLTTAPACSVYDTVVEAQPVYIDGYWQQSYLVRPLNAQELLELAEKVRTDRNARLAACDWTQVYDAPVNRQAWLEYRQLLRDVTAQSGFPCEVVWPSCPTD